MPGMTCLLAFLCRYEAERELGLLVFLRRYGPERELDLLVVQAMPAKPRGSGSRTRRQWMTGLGEPSENSSNITIELLTTLGRQSWLFH